MKSWNFSILYFPQFHKYFESYSRKGLLALQIHNMSLFYIRRYLFEHHLWTVKLLSKKKFLCSVADLLIEITAWFYRVAVRFPRMRIPGHIECYSDKKLLLVTFSIIYSIIFFLNVQHLCSHVYILQLIYFLKEKLEIFFKSFHWRVKISIIYIPCWIQTLNLLTEADRKVSTQDL